MDKDLEDQLLKAMGFTTLKLSCEECKHWREENEKTHYLSVCTYNTIGEMKICQLGRCDKFKRKQNMDKKEKVESFNCSFCDKSHEEVFKLISGREGVYICNDCVGL